MADNAFKQHLIDFSDSVRDNSASEGGDPEAQLTVPMNKLLEGLFKHFDREGFLAKREVALPGGSKPDFCVLKDSNKVGYIELKAPGKGADSGKLSQSNRKQFDKFISQTTNLMYTDGNQFALYQYNNPVGRIVNINSDILGGGAGLDEAKLEDLENLFEDFFAADSVLPIKSDGKLDFETLSNQIAWRCQQIKKHVFDAIDKDGHKDFLLLKEEWSNVIFPYKNNDRFADDYAQAVIFSLLIARSEGANLVEKSPEGSILFDSKSVKSKMDNPMLEKTLELFTSSDLEDTIIHNKVRSILEYINAIDVEAFKNTDEPWIHFYEDFLATYDPEMRKAMGVYYTPSEVVDFQVRATDMLLKNELGIARGFSDDSVYMLDPAVGTGTYLLSVIQHAIDETMENYGEGALGGLLESLSGRITGFEILFGPYAVAELRIRQMLRKGKNDRRYVKLTNTLENTEEIPNLFSLSQKAFTENTREAWEAKNNPRPGTHVIIGNPPYGRSPKLNDGNRLETGAWIRHGNESVDATPILDDFVKTLTTSESKLTQHMYNDFVYFWRFALWNAFELNTESEGVISFITSSAFLTGDAHKGMRHFMRKSCEKIYILDLGGDNRGAVKEDNVFNIETPVSICFAIKSKACKTNQKAEVFYTKIEGDRAGKFSNLESIDDLALVAWDECGSEWKDDFVPDLCTAYDGLPDIQLIMPAKKPGVVVGRTWTINPSQEILSGRLNHMASNSSDLVKNFKESADISIEYKGGDIINPGQAHARKSLKHLKESDKLHEMSPSIHMYGYRSFDRQHVVADTRFINSPRLDIWESHSDKQVYLTTWLKAPISTGAPATITPYIPDFDHFAGRGGGGALPFYRDKEATMPNLPDGFLKLLSKQFEEDVSADDFFGYLYGILGHTGYQEKFANELAHSTPSMFIPITKDIDLFREVSEVGKAMIWLHCWGERYQDNDRNRGNSLLSDKGNARIKSSISTKENPMPITHYYDPERKAIIFGDKKTTDAQIDNGEVGVATGVSQEVYDYEVSGMKIIRKWLGYRKAKPAGKKSSPLNDIVQTEWTQEYDEELLYLLWMLEKTIANQPKQAELLDEVLAGDCFTAKEIPKVNKKAFKMVGSSQSKNTLR